MTEPKENPTQATNIPSMLRLMAESFVQSAARDGNFAIAIYYDAKKNELLLARSHRTDDFYDAMQHVIDIYKKAEADGRCEHVLLSAFEN